MNRQPMAYIPVLAEAITSAFDKDPLTRQEVADFGVLILELGREEEYYGDNIQRITELRKLIAVQGRVVDRLLAREGRKQADNKQHRGLKLVEPGGGD